MMTSKGYKSYFESSGYASFLLLEHSCRIALVGQLGVPPEALSDERKTIGAGMEEVLQQQ